MKYVILLIASLSFVVDTVQAQIKLGDNIDFISPYALLELESTEKGLLLPRLSTQQRNTFFGEDVPPGLLIFNTDSQKIQYARSRISSSSKELGIHWENLSNEHILSQSMGATPTIENPTNGMLFYQDYENDLYVYNEVLAEWVLIAGANFLSNRNPLFSQNIRYRKADGQEELLDLGMLSTSDSQVLTVSTTIIGISNGNEVDVQPLVINALGLLGVNSSTLVGPQGIQGPLGAQGIQGIQGLQGIQGTPGIPGISSNTDSQTIQVSSLNASNTLTIAISNGNTQTLDLSSLSTPSSTTDSQTLSVSSLNGSNTLTIAISNGNTQTLDLSSLSSASTNTDSQTIQVSNLNASNTLTIAISNGNTQTLDLSTLAAVNLFEVNGNVVRSRVGTSSHDFVFGSDTLDNQTGALDDARFFFDKSKAAFRAGYASGSSWNEVNIGERSFGMGYRTQASGDRSIAMGNATEAQSYAATAFGSYNTIVSPLSTSSWNSDDRLFVVGNGSSSSKKSDALVILKNGNIGIGDSTPTEGTLVVSGTIIASRSIIASATLTPDYVFDYFYTGESKENPKYRFLNLAAIEQFIQQHRHLPNIPSAEMVKAQGGIILNRASELQLEKIEELYLFAIEQEKRIKQLETTVARLVKEVKRKQ
ncbi:MAG: hypothetical protein QNL42_05610 [Flavobacteriaceae bacterium]